MSTSPSGSTPSSTPSTPASHKYDHSLINYKPRISQILHESAFNKSTAFTMEERQHFGLRGLLPSRVESLDEQTQRALRQLRSFDKPIDKYVYLQSLRERNETLFFHLVIDNLVECNPIIYTPTVGEACQKFSRVYRTAQGMFLSLFHDKGYVRKILDNWPGTPDIIVVTDGSRILGLGDLGINGMGIPIGKLALYVAAAGFHPSRTLPIVLDVGTNNETYLNDELYLGERKKRVRGQEFYNFCDEFLMAVKDKWPECLVQFEDFSNDVCFDLLEMYRERLLCFNDDIQGTGAVVVSGWINAVKLSGVPMKDHRMVFYGAGSAAVGVADQIATLMEIETGMSQEEVLKHFYLVDSKGLVIANRSEQLEKHKVKYARKDVTSAVPKLLDVIKTVKPTCLIGLSGQGQAFTKEIIEEMAALNEKPIIFSLSNPTTNSECSANDAYTLTKGKAIFASGSPFDPVEYEGKTLTPGQANNMYIFPGLGLGAVICKAKHVSDTMISAASSTLAKLTSEEELADGKIYPSLKNIRQISRKIAAAVARQAVREDVSDVGEVDYDAVLEEYIYDASYPPVKSRM